MAESLSPTETIEGFPPGCFLAAPPNPDYVFGFAIWSCPTQAFWIQIIVWLYAGQADELVLALEGRFDGAAVTYYPTNALYPAWASVIHRDYCCVVTAGTDTLAQGLIQAIQLIAGPQDFGGFSTAQLWYQFASWILKTLTAAGVTDGRPLMLAGHSYGGAAAMVATAIALQGQAMRQVKYLTFGSPKPGDTRLWKILRNAFDGLSLVLDGDTIAAMPPSSDLLAAMTTLLPGGPYTSWTQWVYPPETARMVGAKVIKNDYQTFDSADLAALLLGIIATGALPTFPQHASAAYLSAIELRCKVPLFVPTFVVQALGMDATAPADIVTLCCPDGMPPVLMAQVTAATGDVAPLLGTIWHLRWGFFANAWGAAFIYDDEETFISLLCDGGAWVLGAGLALSFEAEIGATCAPLTFVIPDGSVSPSGSLTIVIQGAVPCPPQPEETVPPGMIMGYCGGGTLPTGFLACDGSAVSRTTYADLFAAIGITWGAGDGSTTFNVPDLRGRSAVGTSPGGLGTDRPTARDIAAVGGEETHQLVTSELSGHTHAVTDPSHYHDAPQDGFFVTDAGSGIVRTTGATDFGANVAYTERSTTGITIGSTGGDTPHNNMQPFAVITWCIAY